MLVGLSGCRTLVKAHPDGEDDILDGSFDSGGDECDVLAQTGCNTGEKCTWIWDERDATAELGHIGCVMDGTVAADAACTFNMDPIGFDNCVGGTFCLDGVCKEICDNNGGQPMCPSNKSCGAYSGVFGASGQPVAAGLCDQKCDPLSQRLLGSDGNPDPAHEACDSPTPQGTGSATGSGSSAGPEEGCYTADFIAFTCASTPEGRGTDVANTLVDRAACTPANGCAFDSTQFFTNGCDPGFVSFFLDTTGSSQVDCTRLCAPLESDKTMPLANAKGDDTVAGKLPDDAAPVAGHAACIAGSGAADAGEECRFLWQFITDLEHGCPEHVDVQRHPRRVLRGRRVQVRPDGW